MGENEETSTEPEAPEVEEIEEREAYRSDKGVFGGVETTYTAKAATLVFDIEETKASFFYVSYTQDDADPATRPVLFCFNGGPGSSTVWLHLGLFGPRRMELDDEGFKVGMQGRLVDNEHSILDVADVVCIDAIGTGFSTTAPKEKEEDFHHLKHDIDAFSRFIVHYLDRHGRWASPKYLAGESYGTLRGAAISRELFHTHRVELNGIILISTVLSYQTLAVDRDTWMFQTGNELPFALYLPTYAATAWYHGKLPKKLQSKELRELLDEVEDFSLGDYWSALARGDRLDERSRARTVRRVADFTGLDIDYVDHCDLRIHIHRFCKELLRSEKRTVGRIDSRYVGIDPLPYKEALEIDPSTDATVGVAASALNHYLREELGFETRDIYELMSMKVNERWNYEDFNNRYVDTSESLKEVLSRSPGTRVLVASGFYDLATPHFATDYTFSHMGLDPEVKKRVQMEYYEAGHMMYVHRPSLERLATHLREFIADS